MIDTLLVNAPSLPELRASSPSKINLSLEVLGRRSDGFHEIRSLVLGVGLFDRLEFTATNDGRLTLSCDDPALPCDQTNLVYRAAAALRRACPDVVQGARIHLSKRIPLAAGLGGGSGNAAVTLEQMNRLWGAGLDADVLKAIGAELGSDVPVFFAMPSAVVCGRGENVEPVAISWSGWVVLAFAGVAVSTADVYHAWRPEDRTPDVNDRIRCLMHARSAGEAGAACVNELEPAIFRVSPAVRELRDAVAQRGADHVHISGAGQTAYVLFDDPDEAESLRRRLHEKGVGVGARVVRPLNVRDA